MTRSLLYRSITIFVWAMDRKNRYLALIVSLVLISGTISPAFVTPAFATTETLYMVSKGGGSGGPSQLWTLDKTTGIATPLANPVGFVACSSMDFVFGVLHAACESSIFGGDGTENGLISIDHLTGIGTAIGSNGGFFNYGGMSTHPTTGTLYAFQTSGPGTASGLGTMNLVSGLFTALGTLDLLGGNGMAFSPGGTLYIARADTSGPDTINTVNLGNGDETVSGTIGYNGALADDDKTTAMDFDGTGTLWAAIKKGDGGTSADTYLATIVPTGASAGDMNTPVLIKDVAGDAIVGVDGIAFLEDDMFDECFVHVEWDNPLGFTSPTPPTGSPPVDFDDECPGGDLNTQVPATLECGVTPDNGNAPIPLCRIIVPNFIDELDLKIILIDITFSGSPTPSMQPTVTCFDPTLPFGQGVGNLFDSGLDGSGLFIWDFECRPNPDWEEILIYLDPNVQKIQIWTTSFDDPEVGGISIPIDQSALLLAGVQSISMWMIPVVIAGIGIGIFVIKKRK